MELLSSDLPEQEPWLGNGAPLAVETNVAEFPLVPLAVSTSVSCLLNQLHLQHSVLIWGSSRQYQWKPLMWK